MNTRVARRIRSNPQPKWSRNFHTNRPSVIVIAHPYGLCRCRRFKCNVVFRSKSVGAPSDVHCVNCTIASSIPATSWRYARPLGPRQKGAQEGLENRRRTVILFLNSTIFSEVPPLRAVWARTGEQARAHPRSSRSPVLDGGDEHPNE